LSWSDREFPALTGRDGRRACSRRGVTRLYDHAGIDKPEPQTAEEVTATMVIDASRYPPWCVVRTTCGQAGWS
jgi:hypothetical protein